MKIIPAIDLMDGKVVRLVQGDPKQKTVYSEQPIEIAKKWQNAGADFLHLVDLDATLGLGSNLELIEKISNEIDIPVQVAGGLRTVEKISNVLEFAQRVVIGTIAFELVENKQRDTLSTLISKFGKDRLVISIDHNDGEIVTHGWQKSSGIKLFDALNQFVDYGFSEFLMTNISKDGMLEGPDIVTLKEATKINNANIIASGGVSNPNDLVNIKNCNPFGVILGKALYENLVTIEEAKKI